MQAVNGISRTKGADGRMLGEQPGWPGLTGQQSHEYRGCGWADAFHPDDAQPTMEAWNAALAARASKSL